MGDGGKLFDAKVLSITPESIIEKFKAKSQNLTALSLGSGYIVSSAAPHYVARAFKNLAAVSLASGFEIEQLKALKAAAAAGPATSAPAGKADAAPKKEKVEEEEEDLDMGGMFGDDDY